MSSLDHDHIKLLLFSFESNLPLHSLPGQLLMLLSIYYNISIYPSLPTFPCPVNVSLPCPVLSDLLQTNFQPTGFLVGTLFPKHDDTHTYLVCMHTVVNPLRFPPQADLETKHPQTAIKIQCWPQGFKGSERERSRRQKGIFTLELPLYTTWWFGGGC